MTAHTALSGWLPGKRGKHKKTPRNQSRCFGSAAAFCSVMILFFRFGSTRPAFVHLQRNAQQKIVHNAIFSGNSENNLQKQVRRCIMKARDEEFLPHSFCVGSALPAYRKKEKGTEQFSGTILTLKTPSGAALLEIREIPKL